MKKNGCFVRTNCSERLKKVYSILLDSDLNFKDYCYVMNFIIEIIQDNIDLDLYINNNEKEYKKC